MSKRFEGEVALVTGGGQGIGLATACKLASEGAQVVIGELVTERIPRAVQEIEKHGAKALGFAADVTDRDQVQALVGETLSQRGRLDVLVNNAGTDLVRSVAEMSDEEWNLQIDVNLKGTFYCCRAAVPPMIEGEGGAIINIASAAGWLCYPQGAAYAAAKAGVMGFTRSLAGEVASSGIRVNAVAPGPIDTPLAHAVLDTLPEAQSKGLLAAVVLGRWGKPEEIANAVAFLASDEASYITGESLSVSGGMFMH